MSNTVTYLQSAAELDYRSEAFDWIGDELQKGFINDAAAALGICAGAIAGAMVEENHDYWHFPEIQNLLDKYALSGIDPVLAAAELPLFLSQGTTGVAAYTALYTYELENTQRSHDEWAADYAVVKADTAPGKLDKLLHPSLVDVGYGNFKVATAIRLVDKYSHAYPALGLDIYLNDYATLAKDLADEQNELTAKLYAVYLKEADDWFRDHNAYDGQWDALPQAFRDALLVSFVNAGEDFFADRVPTNGRYEPQPMLTTGAGMNHLRNAPRIGALLGIDDYTGGVTPVEDFIALAKTSTTDALAYRYALLKLRHVAVTGIDYGPQNTSGELSLYDTVTGKGELTDAWLDDRAAMLSWQLKYDLADKVYDEEWNTSEIEGNWDYIDLGNRASGKPFTLAIDGNGLSVYDHQIVFGTQADETIEGSGDSDRLYGGGGNDALDGGSGDDYLEGNAGADTLRGNGGDDRIYGGDGDDHLYGGTGNDILVGEAGEDTYYYNIGDGNDTVFDLQGANKLVLNGKTVTEIARLQSGSNIFEDSDGNRYVWLDTGEMVITLAGSTTQETLTLNWFDELQHDFGITVKNAQVPEAPVNTTQNYVVGNGEVTVVGGDILMGGQGSDYIEGGDGDDNLWGNHTNRQPARSNSEECVPQRNIIPCVPFPLSSNELQNRVTFLFTTL